LPPATSTLSLHDALPILRDALRAGDTRRTERAAHRLKGAAAALGARAVQAAVTELETMVRESRLDEAVTVLDKLERELRQVAALDRKSTRLNSSHEWISY